MFSSGRQIQMINMTVGTNYRPSHIIQWTLIGVLVEHSVQISNKYLPVLAMDTKWNFDTSTGAGSACFV